MNLFIKAMIRFCNGLMGCMYGLLGGIVLATLIMPVSGLALILLATIPMGIGALIGMCIPPEVYPGIVLDDAPQDQAAAPAGIEADFNRVVEINHAIVPAVNMDQIENARMKKIHDENNALLDNLDEREKIALLTDQEIADYQKHISTLSGKAKQDAEKNLVDYQAYAEEPCVLDDKSKHDADFNPLTIHGDYTEEGQQAGRQWATTYHFEDLQKYIQSCNDKNQPALTPHSRDPLHDPIRITIYKGFMSSIISFIKNVRETLQQLQIANEPEQKRQTAINARLALYSRLFSANKANDSTIPSAPPQESTLKM
jgi:hypothetical protein